MMSPRYVRPRAFRESPRQGRPSSRGSHRSTRRKPSSPWIANGRARPSRHRRSTAAVNVGDAATSISLHVRAHIAPAWFARQSVVCGQTLLRGDDEAGARNHDIPHRGALRKIRFRHPIPFGAKLFRNWRNRYVSGRAVVGIEAIIAGTDRGRSDPGGRQQPQRHQQHHHTPSKNCDRHRTERRTELQHSPGEHQPTRPHRSRQPREVRIIQSDQCVDAGQMTAGRHVRKCNKSEK